MADSFIAMKDWTHWWCGTPTASLAIEPGIPSEIWWTEGREVPSSLGERENKLDHLTFKKIHFIPKMRCFKDSLRNFLHQENYYNGPNMWKSFLFPDISRFLLCKLYRVSWLELLPSMVGVASLSTPQTSTPTCSLSSPSPLSWSSSPARSQTTATGTTSSSSLPRIRSSMLPMRPWLSETVKVRDLTRRWMFL